MTMISRVVVALMLCVLAAPVWSAKPDRIVEFPDATLLLQDKPCEIGLLLAQVEPQHRHKLRGGAVLPKADGAVPHKLCYVEQKTKEGVDILSVIDEYGNGAAMRADEAIPLEPPLAHPKHQKL